MFVGGGNTFRLLKELYTTGAFQAIREKVEAGMPYMGASAGSNITMLNANTTNDMPITQVLPSQLLGLHIFPFNLNPHYIEKVEGSNHLGESRDLRIQQFHEEQNNTPVIGLKEGACIMCVDGEVKITGSLGAPAVLLQHGKEKQALSSGEDLSALLSPHF